MTKRCKDCKWKHICESAMAMLESEDMASRCLPDQKYYERKLWKFWRPK